MDRDPGLARIQSGGLTRIQIAYWDQCLGSGLDPDSVRPVDPDPDPDPGGQNDPQKIIEKSQEISCFQVLDVLF